MKRSVGVTTARNEGRQISEEERFHRSSAVSSNLTASSGSSREDKVNLAQIDGREKHNCALVVRVIQLRPRGRNAESANDSSNLSALSANSLF